MAKTHGRRSTYTNGGCRCDPCRAAERAYWASPAGKAVRARYKASPKGQAVVARYEARYRASPKSAANEARYRARHREELAARGRAYFYRRGADLQFSRRLDRSLVEVQS